MTTTTTPRTVLVTGASSGFGALTVRALADAGHTVYAGMRDTAGRNARATADALAYASEHGVVLRPVEMDVVDQHSVDAAVRTVVDEAGRVDVVVHNAGHMVLGPREAFTPEQLAQVYDTNVLSTQRVNRAVLPHLRAQRDGLVVWIGSFTVGTNHFANAGQATDTAVVDAYQVEYAGLTDQVAARLAELAPADQDPSEVARAVVDLVDTPKGRRPFRVHVDPADDGAAVVFALGDRVRAEFYRRVGLEDLLVPVG